MRNPTEMAFYAAANAQRTLRAGFTTVRHLGAREFIDVGLRNAIAAGLTDGPRILAAGNAITATGGELRPSAVPGAAGRSEEHTSELQSLMRISYAVFCLKKKNKRT